MESPRSHSETRGWPVCARCFALVLLTLWWPAIAWGAEPPVATWKDGGRLEREDYESWRAVHGLEDGPEAIREMVFVLSLARITRQSGDADSPEARLQLEAIRHRLIVPALQSHVEGGIVVSEEEVEEWRLSSPGAFSKPRKIRLRHLYRQLDAGDPESTWRTMRSLRRQLEEGADFEQLARRHSESQSRFRGGLLGFLEPGDLAPEVARAVADLELGDMTDIVEHGGGLSISRLEQIREASSPDVAEVRRRIRANLLRQRQRLAWQGLEAKLLEEARVTVAARGVGDGPSSTAPSMPALSMVGYRLEPRDVRALATLRFPDREPETLSDAELESMLRGWAASVAAVHHAEKLGLDRELASELRWRLEGELARRELVRRIDARLKPADEKQVRRFFEARGQRLRKPAEARIDAILFGALPPASAEKRLEEVRSVVRAVEGGELSFAEAARRHSVHASAATGGELGWRKISAWANEGILLGQALRALEPGQLSGLLHLESGLWLVRLRERRPSRAMSFEEARPQIERALRKQQIEQLQDAVRLEHFAELDIQLQVTEPAATTD